jgi:hypothetical protein
MPSLPLSDVTSWADFHAPNVMARLLAARDHVQEGTRGLVGQALRDRNHYRDHQGSIRLAPHTLASLEGAPAGWFAHVAHHGVPFARMTPDRIALWWRSGLNLPNNPAQTARAIAARMDLILADNGYRRCKTMPPNPRATALAVNDLERGRTLEAGIQGDWAVLELPVLDPPPVAA